MQNLRPETPQEGQRVAEPADPRCERNEVPVYNLTVERSHLYYAGGFLVHNCDSSSQALSYMIYSSGYAASMNPDKRREAEEELLRQEKETFLSDVIYDVYGLSGGGY